MKNTIFLIAAAAATLLSAGAFAESCGQGGGARPIPAGPYPTGPYATPYLQPAGLVPPNVVQTGLTTPTAPSAPQARLTVVPAEAPKGNLQIASPVKTENPTPKATGEGSATDSKSIEATAAAKPEDTAVSEAIKGLVGSWRAVSRSGDGSLSTVELKLDSSGWAKLTVPGTDGKPATTTRKVELENSELKLTGDDTDVLLGKLVEFNSRQMVLERSGGQVTFVRP